MKMNPIRQALAGAGGVAAVALLGAVVLGTQDAGAQEVKRGISNTKHNLTTTGASGNNQFTGGNGEICVFCHTPHGSDTGAVVPLWNRDLTTSNTYQTYASLGTTTLEGTTAVVGSVSMACLSCHDGTQAMNAVVNQPGSGLNPSGTGEMTGTWSGDRVNADGTMKSGIITNIGLDMRDDHPVGIQYAGGFKSTSGVTALPTSGTYTSANFSDPDFNTAQIKTINGNTVWWVDTGSTTGSREKTDILLYSRKDESAADGDDDTPLAGLQPYVECASCHDPHTDNTPTFLRTSNSASAVCLACHIK